MSTPFEPGERVLLLDQRGRRYLVKLESGKTWHYHGGAVPFDLVIGSEEGTVIHSAMGATLTCFRPRLSDFVLKMPRGAQVVYPKDLAAIVMYADIRPGAHVLEAGTGSGALTLALARATGPEGRVVSFEVRPEFHDQAARNVEAFMGKVPEWVDLRRGDLSEAAALGEVFDRVVLDMPEPWSVLDGVQPLLHRGAILCGYLPTIGQVQTLVLGLQDRGFVQVETFEVLLRSWHVTARSVRPDHRMVGHTGFVTVGRLGLSPTGDEEPGRRA